MFEMVFLKADEELTKLYEERLVPKELWPLGQRLRDNLVLTREKVLETIPDHSLLQKQPWIKDDKSSFDKIAPKATIKRFVRWQLGEK